MHIFGTISLWVQIIYIYINTLDDVEAQLNNEVQLIENIRDKLKVG
jgi:hypothetical protein